MFKAIISMNIKDKEFSQPYELLSNGRSVFINFNRDLSKRVKRFPWILKGLMFPGMLGDSVWRSLVDVTMGKSEGSYSVISEASRILITEVDEAHREIYAQIDWHCRRGWFSIEWTVGRAQEDKMEVCFELCNLLNNQILFGHVFVDSFSHDIKIKFFFHQDLIQHDRAWALNAYRKSFWEAYYLHQPFDLAMKYSEAILQIFDNQVNRAKFSAS